MKCSIREKAFSLWLYIVILIISISGIVIWNAYNSYLENQEVLLDKEISRLNGEVTSILETYANFSNYLYSEIEEDDYILSIIDQANTASDQDKEDLRADLYKYLLLRYENMTDYNFRQLHFHLPTTESFLRMHAPEKYGDLLADVRDTVRYTNEEQAYVAAFEEGRIYNGFRYVYPLFYKDQHIGSVEISISSASVLETLSVIYPESDFYFILDKSVVDEKVLQSERENYSDSLISSNFFFDKEVEEIFDSYNSVIPHNHIFFYELLHGKYEERLNNYDKFSIVEYCEGKEYVASFLPVKNFNDTPVAYFISIENSDIYLHMRHTLIIQMTLIIILTLITTLIMFLIMVHFKLKFVSETDHLTKIFNRRKFHKEVSKLIKLNKKETFTSAILLIDIDLFKKVNDTYGHNYGDQVLVELTALIAHNIRDKDIFARWGGEEFILLMSNANPEKACHVGEKLRALVENEKSGRLANITVSIGTSSFNLNTTSIEEAINQADAAMYKAKSSGRNRVCCLDFDKTVDSEVN